MIIHRLDIVNVNFLKVLLFCDYVVNLHILWYCIVVVATSLLQSCNREEVYSLIISFLVSVGAGIVVGLFLYFVCKWLDRILSDN